MSRIRSIHPGFFTDEDLLEASITARLLFLGLCVEADDKGIFEWKLVTLKIRIFPNDNLEVESLLDELVDCGNIRMFEALGKKYGAIKNFRKFQRPKSPNNIHPISEDEWIYVGLKEPIGEMNGVKLDTFLPKGEMSPQREEGGGNTIIPNGIIAASGSEKSIPGAKDITKIIFDSGIAELAKANIPEPKARSIIGMWRKNHGDAAVLVAISRCQSYQPQEPVEWISGSLKHQREQANGSDKGIGDGIFDAAFEQLREMRSGEQQAAQPGIPHKPS